MSQIVDPAEPYLARLDAELARLRKRLEGTSDRAEKKLIRKDMRAFQAKALRDIAAARGAGGGAVH